jgi:hypothetical protein
LPHVSHADIDQRIDDILNSSSSASRTLPWMNVQSTTDAIITGVLRETVLYMRNIMFSWADEMKHRGHLSTGEPNSLRVVPVYITGGDGKMLLTLLQNETEVALEAVAKQRTSANMPSLAVVKTTPILEMNRRLRKFLFLPKENTPTIQIDHEKHAIHQAISRLISNKIFALCQERQAQHTLEVDLPSSNNSIASQNKHMVVVDLTDEEVSTNPNKKKQKTSSSPTKKVALNEEPVSTTVSTSTPKKYVNRRLAKYFTGVIYFGSVTKHVYPHENEENIHLFTVVYDDDDVEDLDPSELQHAFELYEQNKGKDRIGKSKKSPKK